MNDVFILILVFVIFFGLMFTGIPLAFVLGGLTIIFASIFWGTGSLALTVNESLNFITGNTMIAIPLFLFMGSLMRYTGIGDRLFDFFNVWIGGLKGGLAISCIAVCAIFGAMIGCSGPSTLIMGMIALPAMLKFKYDKQLAMGTVCAGGVLAILIPPSIPMIFYGALAQLSVGKLFMAALVPGFLLAFIYMVYIGIRCHFNPDLGPASKTTTSWATKLKLLPSIIEPAIVVVLVLGGIYSGFSTPTEAAGIGSFVVFIIAIIRRTLKWRELKESVFSTFRLCGMVFFLVMATVAFSHLIAVLNVQTVFITLVNELPVSPWVIVFGIMALVFVLGCLMDDMLIILLFTPIFVPIIRAINIDPIWFGIILMININMAWLTPPYGFNLFYMKATVRDSATMGEIYRSVVPFVGCQIVCMVLVMVFPQIILYLPSLMLK